MDRVPPEVRRWAKLAIDAREPGASIADLTHEWWTSGPEHQSRHLRFRGERRSVDVEVREVLGDLTLSVGVRPPDTVRIQVRHWGQDRRGGVSVEGAGSGDGHYEFALVCTGFLSLICWARGPTTQTAWVKL